MAQAPLVTSLMSQTQRLEEQAGCLLAHGLFKAESVSASVFGERRGLAGVGRFSMAGAAACERRVSVITLEDPPALGR